MTGSGVINGTRFDDVLLGTISNDRILGRRGNDDITGNGGNDRLRGGQGNDAITGGDGADKINGGQGNDTILAGGGDDKVSGGAGNDFLDGGANNDDIDGGAGDDTLAGGSGNDALKGGAGSDILNGGTGSDVVNGGAGNDMLIHVLGEASGTLDKYDGDAGNDTLRLVMNRAEWMSAGIQADIANYRSFIAANLNGNGEAKNKVFHFASIGLDANQIENLQIYVDGVLTTAANGSAQNDVISTGPGANFVFAGAGNDLVTTQVDGAPYVVDGGADVDQVVVQGSNPGEIYTIAPYEQGGIIFAGINAQSMPGVDVSTINVEEIVLNAGNGADTILIQGDLSAAGVAQSTVIIHGNGGADVIDASGLVGNPPVRAELYGEGDDDVLIGGAGDDLLDGGAGLDVLEGGAGDDVLDGGEGYDNANYELDLAGISVNLALHSAIGADIGTDTLFNIEVVTGGFGHDTLIGDDNANMLNGNLGGNDTLIGAGGDDFLLGQVGNDLLIGGSGNDTLEGGEDDDVLVGDSVNNIAVVSSDALDVAVSTAGVTSGASFSPDGTKIVFQCAATTLVPGDTNGTTDIFLKDLGTGAITRISTDSSGSQVSGQSTLADFSPDGTKIIFTSTASTLVAGDTNNRNDVFIKDLATGTVTRVSTDSAGLQVNGNSMSAKFSPDGTKIAFVSLATNLVAGDTNAAQDLFVKDLATGVVTLVSADAAGNEGNAASVGTVPNAFIQKKAWAFSPDGTKIAFLSSASNLVAGDTNGVDDIFVKDLTTGAISRISTASDGSQGDGAVREFGFSSDGGRIVFQSSATNLVAGDTNGVSDIFIKDLVTGQTVRVSTAVDGSQTNDISVGPSFSSDGGSIVFASWASNLVANDTNSSSVTPERASGEDIFVKDLTTGAISRLSINASGFQGNNDSGSAIFSPDGLNVVFQSEAYNLVPGTVAGATNLYLVSLTPQPGGDDTLTGGAGSDRFVFGPGDAADVIVDFTDGEDLIDLTAYFGLTWATLQPLIAGDAFNSSIDFGDGNTISLQGVALASLDAGDFLFS